MNPEAEWSFVKWSPEVRLAVREVRQRGASHRSGRLPGPASGRSPLPRARPSGRGHLAGVVYVTSQGPLLLGRMAPSVPRDVRVDDARTTRASERVDVFWGEEWTTGKSPRNKTAWDAGEVVVEPPASLIDSETRPHVALQARCGQFVAEVGALREAAAEGQRLLDVGRPKVLTLSARRG